MNNGTHISFKRNFNTDQREKNSIGFQNNNIFLKKSISEHLENKYRYWPAVTENFMQYKEMKPKKLNILSSKSYFPETILPCSSFYAVLALRKGQKDW